jgi:hypothetical protein
VTDRRQVRVTQTFFDRTSTVPIVAGSEIRVLVTSGLLVEFMAIYTVLAGDGAVEMIYLEIEGPGQGEVARIPAQQKLSMTPCPRFDDSRPYRLASSSRSPRPRGSLYRSDAGSSTKRAGRGGSGRRPA